MSESFGTRRSRASGIFRPKQSLGRRTKPAIEAAYALAADAVEVWVQQGLAAAMNKYNVGGDGKGEG